MAKQLLFSVTKKDLEIQEFCSGGKGGQNQNRRKTGIRIIHHDSGAVGESRTYRTQGQNKKEAFNRLVNSKKFKLWHKIEVSRLMGNEESIDEKVKKAMRPENLKIEFAEKF